MGLSDFVAGCLVGIAGLVIADKIYSEASKKVRELERRGYSGKSLQRQFKKEFNPLFPKLNKRIRDLKEGGRIK